MKRRVSRPFWSLVVVVVFEKRLKRPTPSKLRRSGLVEPMWHANGIFEWRSRNLAVHGRRWQLVPSVKIEIHRILVQISASYILDFRRKDTRRVVSSSLFIDGSASPRKPQPQFQRNNKKKDVRRIKWRPTIFLFILCIYIYTPKPLSIIASRRIKVQMRLILGYTVSRR